MFPLTSTKVNGLQKPNKGGGDDETRTRDLRHGKATL